MNTNETVDMQTVRIERAIREVAELTLDLNELLLRQGFDEAADIVMKIEEAINWIKFQEKQRSASSSNVTGRSLREIGQW